MPSGCCAASGRTLTACRAEGIRVLLALGPGWGVGAAAGQAPARYAPVERPGRPVPGVQLDADALCLAGLLAPLVGTQVLAHLGEPSLWWGCAVLGALSAEGLRRVSRAAATRPDVG